mmetsp:Transcript_21317/g.50668  ORF Transcript_21317/g.50668 Transcript_21317/m.50668 type:complete len:95 (+) Transcript_21317:1842-2126(+)
MDVTISNKKARHAFDRGVYFPTNINKYGEEGEKKRNEQEQIKFEFFYEQSNLKQSPPPFFYTNPQPACTPQTNKNPPHLSLQLTTHLDDVPFFL